MEKKDYYKIYVPIDMSLRKELRLHAALRDMKPADFAALVLKNYLSSNRIEQDLPLDLKASSF